MDGNSNTRHWPLADHFVCNLLCIAYCEMDGLGQGCVWETLQNEQKDKHVTYVHRCSIWCIEEERYMDDGIGYWDHPHSMSFLHRKNYSSMNRLHSSALLSDDPATGLLPSDSCIIDWTSGTRSRTHHCWNNLERIHIILGDSIQDEICKILVRHGLPLGMKRTTNHSKCPQMNYAW